MKKFYISVLSAALALCLSANVGAALLSPGISVLQSEVKMEKGGVAGNTVSFSAEDFKSTLGIKELSAIKITSLPDAAKGELTLDGEPVSHGALIPAEKLSHLCFVPYENGVSVEFGFLPSGGGYTESFICTISMTDEKLDLAPTTRSGEISDMAGISVFSVLWGEGEEGEQLRFSIVSGATHGTVEITDEETGAYCYTPDEGFYGKDSFTFTATDGGGNVSNVSTVTVNVKRNDKNIVYSDMEDSALHLAAAVLCQNDIMLGTKIGGKRTFNPEGKVTRSDFLIMAMNTAKLAAKGGKTEFADEASFTPYEKKYISAASSLGIVLGKDTAAGRCFLPDAPITGEEAALIVCRIAALNGLSLVESDKAVALMSDANYDALAVLANAGVYECEEPCAEISRAETAQMLYALLGYCNE